jgi:hypothetical protein
MPNRFQTGLTKQSSVILPKRSGRFLNYGIKWVENNSNNFSFKFLTLNELSNYQTCNLWFLSLCGFIESVWKWRDCLGLAFYKSCKKLCLVLPPFLSLSITHKHTHTHMHTDPHTQFFLIRFFLSFSFLSFICSFIHSLILSFSLSFH